MALALSGGLQYVCIPSGATYSDWSPRGTTPLVDEMYGIERMFILYDGADASRVEKLQRIVEWDSELVLNHLRVCAVSAGAAFNCGRCHKCVRTAVVLRALGVWDKARTFRDKTAGHWVKVMARDHYPGMIQENLKFAERCGADRQLIRMLRRAVRRRRLMDSALGTGARALVYRTPWRRGLAPTR